MHVRKTTFEMGGVFKRRFPDQRVCGELLAPWKLGDWWRTRNAIGVYMAQQYSAISHAE